MISRQNGYRVKDLRNDFTFGWEYTADKFINKQSTEKHLDDQVMHNAKPHSDRVKFDLGLIKCFTFDVQAFFDGCL